MSSFFKLLNILAIVAATSSLRPLKSGPFASKKLYTHFLPWYETRNSSDNGLWGIHWTMANKNPDNFVDPSTGRREIASWFYPEDDIYASGDPAVLERQLNQMLYAGIDGVLIDWHTTIRAFDYPSILRNAELLIAQLERFGLNFAIIYEDNNVQLAANGGFVPDKIAAAQADMRYIEQNYFNRSNYIRFNDTPILLDFGPLAFKQPVEWLEIMSVFNRKPVFFTLWYQSQEAEGSADGEFAWIYPDYLTGLEWFAWNHTAPQKIQSVYPGFRFYNEGGWPGQDFVLEHNDTKTFNETFQLALESPVETLQLATWNHYGDGNMIEPTREFGQGCLEIIQEAVVPQYKPDVFQTIRELYKMRKEHLGKQRVQEVLDEVQELLIKLEPEKAREILKTV